MGGNTQKVESRGQEFKLTPDYTAYTHSLRPARDTRNFLEKERRQEGRQAGRQAEIDKQTETDRQTDKLVK